MKNSAGILLYRNKNNNLQVFLVHTGGPYGKDISRKTWSIPKGEFDNNEIPFYAALREFKEETGIDIVKESISYEFLGSIKQNKEKIIIIWSTKYEKDIENITSNTFTMEWPKGSGKIQEFPEVDKGQWFDINDAKNKIIKGQTYFLERLES